MQRPGGLPRVGFITASVTMVALAVAIVAMHSVDAPFAYLYLPPLLLATVLCEIAIFVLATILLETTEARANLPLILASTAMATLNGAMYLWTPLPRSDGSLAVTDDSFIWVQATWCIVLAAGAVWYGFERVHPVRISSGDARRVRVTWLPIVGLGTIGYVVLLTRLASHLPPITRGFDTSGYRTGGVGFFCITVLAASLVILTMRLDVAKDRSRTDLAVLYGVLTALVGTLVMITSDVRYALPWVAMRLYALIAVTAILVGIVRQLIDRLSEGYRLEANLLRAEARAFEQNAAVEASLVKSRFVAAVSHELRTPLGGIIGMAELLERTHLNERQRTCTAAIHDSAQTLLRIVNDLLDFSRVESGLLELEDIPFNLVDLVEGVVLIFREQAREKGVALHAFVDPSVPRTINGDPTRVKQILLNLLNNAVRFTAVGSIRVEVTPERWSGAVPMLAFSVRDSGIGIAPGAQERIFNAFTQEDASTSRRFGGTGLGLAIARHLVELMGGRIAVRSTIGIGSTFTFTIPLRDACRNRDATMPLRDMRILVVEGDDAIRDLLQRYVDGWEMRARSVTSVAEARAVVAQHAAGDETCAILLVGPSIPPHEAGMLARELQAAPMLAGADCIYVRGDDDRDVACPEGFAACVSSPLRQSTLFDTIARLRLGTVARESAAPLDFAPRRPRSERILVAEDNEINQSLLVAQLEHLGFGADVVGDGDAAVAAASARPYHLIFMDCQMPGVDGFEAARRIRATGAPGSSAPIVAVTANVLPGYRDICLAAGMSDYLPKPALIEPLTRLVDRWLPLDGAGVSPAPVAPATSASSAAHAARADVRSRLREIFRGDDERVEATIALAFRSLRDGMGTLEAALTARDAHGAGRAAHKLKGVAMEIGLVDVAALARRLEFHVKADEWDLAGSAFTQCRDAIEVGRSLETESA